MKRERVLIVRCIDEEKERVWIRREYTWGHGHQKKVSQSVSHVLVLLLPCKQGMAAHMPHWVVVRKSRAPISVPADDTGYP